jgi:hypothetical protein
VVVTSGKDAAAVRGKGKALDRTAMAFKREQQLTSAGVPDFGRRSTGGHNSFSRPRECHGINLLIIAGMSLPLSHHS